MCVCTHIQTLAHVCTYIRIHPGTYIDIYFFFFAYLYIHVQHIHAYWYIHMHVYTHHRFFFDFFSSSEILRCFPHTVLFFFRFNMKTPGRAYTSPVKRVFNRIFHFVLSSWLLFQVSLYSIQTLFYLYCPGSPLGMAFVYKKTLHTHTFYPKDLNGKQNFNIYVISEYCL